MSQTIFFVAVGIALLALLFWLAFPSRAHRNRRDTPRQLPLEDLTPRHAMYISHIRNALLASDLDYLKSRVPARTLRRVRKERRQVARDFLAGLGDDFRRLDRLARVVAALSAKVNYQHELSRAWLGFRFRFLYALVWVRLSIGPAPVAAFSSLAGLVGSLSVRIETAMNALAEKSVSPVGIEL